MCFLVNFLCCKSSNEDWNTIPNDLKHLSWRNFRDINLEICISIISCPSIKSAYNTNCIKSCEIRQCSVIHCTQHIYLSSPDISLLLIVYSILIEPVIEGNFKIDMISEISRSGGCYKELWFIRDQMIIV